MRAAKGGNPLGPADAAVAPLPYGCGCAPCLREGLPPDRGTMAGAQMRRPGATGAKTAASAESED
eukprot:3884719-Alexandrium_andersonii.AAC.1